jgi:flagellar biosynthesis protein FlhF
MKTLTFRGSNMMEALEHVQRELGPEALIVSVRQVPGGPAWQVWRQPQVEVVAMVSPAVGPSASATAPAAGLTAPATTRVQPRPQVEATQPRRRVEPVARLDRSAQPGGWAASLLAIQRRLLAQGVDEEFVRGILATCNEALGPKALEDETRVQEAVLRQLEAGLITRGETKHLSSKVICLVGTSGSGKTTTTAKLAAYHIRTLGCKVAWVCADTVRAGAVAQARAYAEALRVPLRVAYTPEELAQAVAAEASADLVVVDTPGCNPRREAEIVAIGELLTALPQRATYWVVPATAKETDLMDALAAWEPFGVQGLVLTKLDETRALGSVFNAAWRSQLPLAYFTTGPRVLGEFQPAQASRLVKALLGEAFAR